ncbi:nucleoside/nucleotide kinase family protein [Microterricola viridarii]|uniref:Uridine kinase n=1 Tax=Microterricola viridarii TaxID=412690 RepID=A0A1H1SEZ1_9MICO|nr:hypothetical protein [Microterricola viridarii]SDS45949.1 uridine kinase [Microterricola viridarii]
MELVLTPRVRFLRALGDEIMHNYGHGRTIVAIDGALQSGKTAFGDDLAAVLTERGHPVFRASLEWFHRSREEQAKFGDDTAERYYNYGFDYSLLRRVLVEPFRMGGSTGFVTKAFDPKRGIQVQPKWLTGPIDATLIIDGRFINRPELRGLWNYSIFLDSEPLAGPEGEADRIYFGEAHPRTQATAIVDNHDPAHPRRVFADSC